MKPFKNMRFWSVLLTAVVLSGATAGCGSSSGSGSAQSSSAAVSSTESTAASQSASDAATGSTVTDAASSSTELNADRPVSEGTQVESSDLTNVPADSAAGSSTASSASSDTSSSGSTTTSWPDIGDKTTSTDIKDASGDTPQIVVFGDSQFDNDRTSNGLSAKYSYYAHANVYNCAIGGTTASVQDAQEEVQTPSEFTDDNFIGMAYAATGQVDPSQVFGTHTAYNVFMGCDLSKTDIFVVEYGVNDYFSKRQTGGNGSQTYGGALEVGCAMLKNKFPDAAILICGPGYAQFYQGDTYIGDSNSVNNGVAWLLTYADTAQNVASDKGYGSFNAYRQLGVDTSNASDYLLDGVHLNPSGREKYAMALARISLHILGYQLPEMVDLSTADYSTFTKSNG